MYTNFNINQEMGEEPLSVLIERLTRTKESLILQGADPDQINAIIDDETIRIEATLPGEICSTTATQMPLNKDDNELSNLPEPTLPDLEGGKYVHSTYSVDVSGDVDYWSFVNIIEEYAKKNWDGGCFPRMSIRTIGRDNHNPFRSGVWADITGYRKETEEETKAREQKEHENMMSIAKKIEEKEKRQERLRYLSMMNPASNQEGWEYASNIITGSEDWIYLLKIRENGGYCIATFEDGVWLDEYCNRVITTSDSICKLISLNPKENLASRELAKLEETLKED